MGIRRLRFLSVLTLLLSALEVLSIPNLGIQRDWLQGGEDSNGDYKLQSFSSVLDFNADEQGDNPVDSLSDAQLVGMASVAFDEMIAFSGPSKPEIMVLLASGNSLYFASSLRGSRDYFYGTGVLENHRPQELIDAAGGVRISGSFHKTANHGEVNVMDLFYTRNGRLSFQGTSSRIIAWGIVSGIRRPYNPCSGTESRYGCKIFLQRIANPSNPQAPLNKADLINIDQDTSPDFDLDGLSFVNRNPRADYNTACSVLDMDFDPDHPE
ncbi:MAG: hypothetical protein Q9219_007627 [cf. Caloplaca sp. 3 TL-2023]